MRILGEEDKPFKPRNEIEEHICIVITTMSNHDIRCLWTREEYMKTRCDIDDKPIDPNFDYIVMSGKKYQDWYISGNQYGINMAEEEITKIELIGYWNT